MFKHAKWYNPSIPASLLKKKKKPPAKKKKITKNIKEKQKGPVNFNDIKDWLNL